MTGSYMPRPLTAIEQEEVMTRVDMNRRLLIAEKQRDAHAKEIAYLREALSIIANGTICPELFPDAPRTEEDYELAAKTAMVTAIAALEHET